MVWSAQWPQGGVLLGPQCFVYLALLVNDLTRFRNISLRVWRPGIPIELVAA
ncbi:hypothetical protein LY76DRAFT_599116 [Colletotrichum caudatum]|nr:hypothetical protein LY76DRAFT_599116 [Colletotrichum caudatum]